MSLVILPVFAVSTKSFAIEAKAEALAFPDEAHSLQTVEAGATGVLVFPNAKMLVTSVGPKPTLLKTPFNPGKKSREKTFGKLTDSTRLALPEIHADWQGGWMAAPDVLVLLDGKSFRLLSYDLKRNVTIDTKSIPYDLIKPARDKGGEGPQPEVAALRKRFRSEYGKTSTPRFTGVAPVPNEWMPGENPAAKHFLVAGRVKGSPLGVIACQNEGAINCQLLRQCFLDGAKGLDNQAVSGVGVSLARRLVVMADRSKHLLRVFKFSSCFHVAQTKAIELPKKIKNISSVYVDEDDRLWITSSEPDDYLNASVYFWDADQW